MGELRACASCATVGQIMARRLCSACYRRHRRNGTIEQYPAQDPRRPGVAADPPGMSYRQLDYWVRRGYLRPGNADAGSGSTRQWPAEELRVAALMARLVDAGLQPATACVVARANRNRYELAPGIVVRIGAAEDGVPSGEVSRWT